MPRQSRDQELMKKNRELRETNRLLRAEIDARRAAEEAVRTRDLWLRAILDNAPIEIALKDRRGRIMAISQNVARDHGLSTDAYVGKTTENFIPPEVAASYMLADQEIIADGRPIQQAVTEDWEGRTRHLLNQKFPLRDENGTIIGICSLTSDMTQLKEAEQRLNQSQKMEAIGKLTGGIAHDVNNLLAVIQGSAELILLNKDDIEDHLAVIVQATERGADLTQRLLAFARQQPLRPQRIVIDRIVIEATTLLKYTLGPSVHIRLDLPPDTWFTTVDPGQIENVILNLALNARDAMPDGGRLSISCTNVRLGDSQAANKQGLEIGDYVCLEVADSGSGMSAEVLERAFDPFFTTKEEGKGSGLGLSMVYGFAKQSGGQATIESQEGKGTKVRMFLPRSASPANVSAGEPELPSETGKGERVLVVEDESAIRVMTEQILTSLEYEPTVVSDTDAALRALRNDGPFDLLLSDVILGEALTGLDLARKIRVRNPNIALVLMSGYPGKAEDAPPGCQYLKKPFRRSQLARTLRAALEPAL